MMIGAMINHDTPTYYTDDIEHGGSKRLPGLRDLRRQLVTSPAAFAGTMIFTSTA